MYRFRITVESLSPATEGERLEFEAVNHDDIISIARRMSGRLALDEDAARAFAVGLKLFGETILKNRANPLFSPLRPAFSEFVKNLKAQGRPQETKLT